MANAEKALTAAKLVSLESVLKECSIAFCQNSIDLVHTRLIFTKLKLAIDE